MEGEINSWMTQNKDIADELDMKIEAVEKEFVNVKIEGSIIQVVMPFTSQDSFLAIFLDSEEGDETLFELNEKLEQIRLSDPECTSKVLGLMVKIFEKQKRNKLRESGDSLVSCVGILAEDARLQCERALSACPSDNPSILQAILPWCSVSLIPKLEAIELQMEIKGIMAHNSLTTGLGFFFERPLVIHLHFSSNAWSSIVCPLDIFRSAEVFIKQSPHQYEQLRDSVEKMTVGVGERRGHAITKKLEERMRPYGPNVMVPILVKDFFDNCKIAMDGSLCVGEEKSEADNLIVSLLISLGKWMKNVENWCVVCRKRLPPFSRLWYCHEDLCVFRVEEFGIGASVHRELKKSELIDMEITLAATAARCDTRDVFEPYPSFLLKKDEIQKRSGFFSSIESGEATASEPRDFLANKNLDLISQLIDSFPPVAELQECSNEIELILKLGISWLQKDCKFDVRDDLSDEEYADQFLLPYRVLSHVLLTNRSSICILENNDKLNVGALHEFAVLHNSEIEEILQQRRATEESSFAFHGSNICNWYSFIRNGIKCLSQTELMADGTCDENSIYLTFDMKKAYRYCLSSSLTVLGKSKKYRVMALCEVFSWKKYIKSSDLLAVSNQNDVVIQYLFVFDGNYDGDIRGVKVKERNILHFS